MKVLFLLDSLGAGGAEHSTALLLPRLASLGVDVSVVTLYAADEGSEADVRGAGIPVTVLCRSGYRERIAELRRILKREQPDILHTALFAADQIGRIAAAGLPVKVISSFVNVPRTRALLPPDGPPRWKTTLVNGTDALTCHLFVDRFHAVTPGVARLYAKAYRIDPRKVTVVERGRPVNALGERSPARRERVRASLDLEGLTPVVVAVGRHEHQKAHTDLVRAMELVTKQHPNAVLLIVGREGNASKDLRAEIEARPSLRGNVLLLGHRHDVPDLLAAADVMALPSRFEGTAGVALEAMALGTPIVSTRLDGMEGILIDETNALVAEVGDVAGMAHSIGRVLTDPALGERLAVQGRQDFFDRFTLERSADRMAELYSGVLNGRTS